MLEEENVELHESKKKLRFGRPGFSLRRPPAAVDGGSRAPAPRAYEASSEYVALKVHLHQQLLEMINLSAIEKLRPEEFRMEAAELIKELLFKEQIPLNSSERNKLVDDITDEVLGLGPIEPLLKDPTVSDVIINTHERVFVERAGQLESTEVKFKDEKHLLRIIDKIVSRVGRRVDEFQPDGGCSPTGWVAGQCGHSAARGGRPIGIDPKIRGNALRSRPPYRERHNHTANQGTSRGLGACQIEHTHFRWHGQREDDLSECSVALHQQPGAHRHHRGCRRAPAPASARSPA